MEIDQNRVDHISNSTGLDRALVRKLLRAGWTFVEKEGEASTWVSPEANVPIHISHNEPWCLSCRLTFPHRHGFSCDKDCPECHGICHPDCPAYKET